MNIFQIIGAILLLIALIMIIYLYFNTKKEKKFNEAQASKDFEEKLINSESQQSESKEDEQHEEKDKIDM